MVRPPSPCPIATAPTRLAPWQRPWKCSGKQIAEHDALRAEQATAKERAEAAERRNQMLALADDLETKVKSIAERVSIGADAIGDTAGRMGRKIDESASRSLKVAEASHPYRRQCRYRGAAAAEELSASITEISRQVA